MNIVIEVSESRDQTHVSVDNTVTEVLSKEPPIDDNITPVIPSSSHPESSELAHSVDLHSGVFEKDGPISGTPLQRRGSRVGVSQPITNSRIEYGRRSLSHDADCLTGS